MRVGLLSSDDELLARLHAPHELHEGVESLAFWRRRLRRLPWYRRGAKREAARMVSTWERRVGAALIRPGTATLHDRLGAARLVVSGPLRRWGRTLAGAALVLTTVVVLVPTLLAIEILSKLF
jgi:hypothetical protein